MQDKSVAIFIDAENVGAKYADEIFKITSDYGEPIIKRIYADWTSDAVKGWKEQIYKYSISSIQNFKFSNGKNSSDMYLLSDAMSVFYEKQDIDLFIIVSSDRDYTPLVQKLRENKKQIVGIGINKPSKFYINAFNHFHCLGKNAEDEKCDELIVELFKAIDGLIEEKQRAILSQIKQKLQEKYPNFNAKDYEGCSGSSAFKKFIMKFTKNKYQMKHEGGADFLIKC